MSMLFLTYVSKTVVSESELIFVYPSKSPHQLCSLPNFPCHAYSFTLTQVCLMGGFNIFACCCDQPSSRQPVCMWLPSAVHVWQSTDSHGSQMQHLRLATCFSSSLPTISLSVRFCVCVRDCRFCLLWLTPLCLATEHSYCSHSPGLSGLEIQQLYCVYMCWCVGLCACSR